MRHLLVTLLLLAAAAPAAPAQTGVLRPGAVAAERIAAGADTFGLFIGGRDGGKPDATMVLDTRFATAGGVPAIVRRETLWVQGRAVQADSLVLARETLAPIASRSQGVAAEHALDFAEGRVRGWQMTGRQRDTVDVALSDRVFLAGGMDLLLAALPLRAGYAAELAVFGDGAVGTARISVAPAEAVRVPGGTVRAWPVTVRGTGADGTYWMEDGTQTLVQYASADRSMRIVRQRGAGARMAAR